ncbi:murein transglycosylase [Thermaurantimonas aggregans]|uniref:Murein transglycosylase n=1 Tax=Thermaurantimonas aggregans TaxID=2173829 RepID=A0A401XIC1_9FLAO|nr:lytic transglycosylase domain-containing protein [Thermaurantimonas aggregans]MCX8149070.1 lytic transglycosylase domain-containing protein [Thermaurantimonas aggregans]GCD76762.1 murein transglycosylase [Thermaurantimonas aggregans]
MVKIARLSRFFKILSITLLTLAAIKLLMFAYSDHDTDIEFLRRFNEKYNVFALVMPDDLMFAGEEVPFDDPEILERFDRELLSNVYFQSQGLLYFKRANKYFPTIEKILRKYNVPDDLKFIALIESGLTNIVSPAGATGPWQLMKDAAVNYGLEVNDEVDERYHLEKATEAACKYLLDAKKRFGSWALAAASYNLGVNGISKQINRQGVTNYFDLQLNQETSRYVFRILAVKEIYNNPKKYGFNFRKKDLYQPIPVNYVTVDTAVSSWPDFAAQFGITYKILRYHNPWIRDIKLTNATGKKYLVAIPKKGYHHIMSDLKGVVPELHEEKAENQESFSDVENL